MRKKQGLNSTKILIKAIIFPYKIHNAQVLLLKSYFLSTGTNEDPSLLGAVLFAELLKRMFTQKDFTNSSSIDTMFG